ncbi:hypothetical protein JCM11641_003521 [Rhodosporidiobolus odoratus]
MATSEPGVSPTRLLVTSLHPTVAAAHLRECLERCPPAPPAFTDLKVVTKSGGKSRCIAFVGFKTHDEAERVRKWLGGAWVAGVKGGSRVRVDWAQDAHADARPAKRTKLHATVSNSAQDDRFGDFMALMAPRKPHPVEETSTTALPLPSPPSLLAAGAKIDSSRMTVIATPESGVSSVSDHLAQDETISDAEYLARRMTRQLQGEGEGREMPEEGRAEWSQIEVVAASSEAHGVPSPNHEGDDRDSRNEASRIRSALATTGRIFVRNLPFSATSSEISDAFSPFGLIQQVHVVTEPSTQTSKGIAYVTFQQSSDAVKAFERLDRTSFQGRLLHLLPASERLAKEARRDAPATLQQERLEERKRNAGDTFSWSTLYLNADAALSAVANRLGVTKSSLLEPSASDPAVKVALAEAHTLAETKRFFEAESVNLEALGRPGPRSSTCILVKNLPFGTTAASLQALFAPFGAVTRLLLPPSGLIAVVEMSDADATAAAWRALVYKQFGGSVLYLERAPAKLWLDARTRAPGEPGLATSAGSTNAGVPARPPTIDAEGDAAVAGATLFVKNLNFETTQPRLQATFDTLPEFLFARIQTKPHPTVPHKVLSMGFGFVGFRTTTAAAAAKTARQGYVLDGHALELRFAQRHADMAVHNVQGDAANTKQKTNLTTKLLVKNVPFEATRAELRQLFGTYGQLKSVRLPRKVDNKTRGFAFLDFATRRDAQAAFDALEHTHLLGRHLVLQWASEAESNPTNRGDVLLGLGKAGSKRKFEMSA